MPPKATAPVAKTPPIDPSAPSPQLSNGVSKFLATQVGPLVVDAPPPPDLDSDLELEPEIPPPVTPKGDDPSVLGLDFAPDSPLPVVSEKAKVEQSKPESIKYFKGIISEKDSRIKQLETETEQLRQRKTPEQVGEALAELQEDPEYRRNYVDYPNQLFENAVKVAESFEVDPEAIKVALRYGDFKQLNTYLRTLIPDDDDARNVVRAHVQQIQQIYKTRREVDGRPFQYVEKIREKRESERAQEDQKNQDEFQTNIDISWSRALEVAARKKDALRELVESDDDLAWNDKVVKPTLVEAQKIYKDTIKDLRLAGGRLTPSLGQRLATLSQVYAVLGMKSSRLNETLKEVEELRAENARLKGVGRPEGNMSRQTPVVGRPAPKAGGLESAAIGFLGQKAKRA